MIGEQLGPYLIQAELGSGGMGRVYLAEGPEGRVAIKIVHPHLLDSAGFFKRFLREAEIGKKVAHQNVVRTLDVDAIGGHHYLVMAYVEGKSLRDLVTDLGTVPETLLREIALQTAAGLAAIHAAGIVHRDLKPENVLITDDHEIRIMDLGVAKLQEASIAITKEGQFAGSVLYAAPEQFGPDGVGPQSDLYSLGVMLYELLLGENPFRRDDIAGVIEAHLELRPPRVADVNSDVTSFFSECVATLLAKNPGERFASADMLAGVLEEGERSEWWTNLVPKLRKRDAHLVRIRVRRETELHGRDTDLKTLDEAWARARSGEGNTVFVEGEAGIGKTRLVDAFLRGLKESEIHVLYGSYPPSGGLGGISQAVLGKFGEAGLANALAPYLTVTPSLVPAFAALLTHQSPPTGSEPLRADALQAVCVQLMRALAEERPLIWVLDDLHFAPKESRDTVLALARAAEELRVLVLTTARPGLPEEERAHLSRLENFRRLTLGRLGAREVAELLDDAFKSEALTEKLGMKIAKKSDGVPFFVFEMIRGLKEGQLIRQQPDGSYVQTEVIDEIEVPSAVRDLIEGRLRGLSKEQRAILDVGAVQGFSFDPGLVAHVLEEKRVRVLQEIAEIERHFGLVRGDAGAACFDQNQIQEVVYQSLIPDLRAEYHALLADAYAARLKGDARGEDAVFLASHHLHGSRPEDGLSHLLPALEYLGGSFRSEEAVALAERALALPNALVDERRVDVLLRHGRQLDQLGRRAQEHAVLEEAVATAEKIGSRAGLSRALMALGFHWDVVARYDEAEKQLTRSVELACAENDPLLQAEAVGRLATVLWDTNRFEEARAHCEEAMELAREAGDRQQEDVHTGNLAGVLFMLGEYGEAKADLERSSSFGFRGADAYAHDMLGLIDTRLGLFDSARNHIEQALALAREIVDRRREMWCTGGLACLLHDTGRFGEALEQFDACLTLAKEIRHRQCEAGASGNLGFTHLALGDLDRARALFDRQFAIAEEDSDERQEAHALHGLGALAEAEEDPDRAAECHDRALGLRRKIHYRRGVAQSLLALAGLDARRGDAESARVRSGEALAIAHALGEPATLLVATVGSKDAPAALSALSEWESGSHWAARLEARFQLWKATDDPAHLAEAQRLLRNLRDDAPARYRESMVECVPLHRDIMGA